MKLYVPRVVAFGYLGPNGAGKTMLIRMLLGLTPESSGLMRLLGLPVREARATALDRANRRSARAGRPDRTHMTASRPISLACGKRLRIARCLLADPELLILDEPGEGVARSGGRYSDSAAGA